MNYVLDACSMLAYLEGEPRNDVVANILKDPENTCYAHSINMSEVYYQMVRKSGAVMASEAITTLLSDGIIERRDMSRQFWKRVGHHKARGRIALPDCFCISLAQELSAQVVTSDHGEFEPLVPLGIVPILFIR